VREILLLVYDIDDKFALREKEVGRAESSERYKEWRSKRCARVRRCGSSAARKERSRGAYERYVGAVMRRGGDALMRRAAHHHGADYLPPYAYLLITPPLP